MIGTAFAWIRSLVVLAILYAFSYEYLYKKYSPLLQQYDVFFRRNKPVSDYQINELFNFSFTSIDGDLFSSSEKNQGLFSHVGPFYELQDRELEKIKNARSIIPKSVDQALSMIPFAKKVDSYFFNFYNWYRIEFTFTDLGHDSYVEFRISEENKGSNYLVQKVSFKLPEDFYAQKPSDKLDNKFTINFKSNGIELNISQFAVPAHYNDSKNDGLQDGQFFALSDNKTQITELDFKKFGSAKTSTQFNFTLKRNDYEVRANLTHVIRHNQCLTNFQKGVLKHKCMGGYAKGRVNYFYFLRNQLNSKQKSYSGDWQRQTFNLDNTRARTTFIGYRSTSNYLGQYLPHLSLQTKQIISKPKWNYKSVQLDFIGFNKLEYYAKKDRIEKQRWVGMSLYQVLQDNGAPLENSILENYLFVNGNIHPIYEIDFKLGLSRQLLKNGQIIRFRNDIAENKVGKKTPSFEIEFLIQNSTLAEESGVLNNKQMFRIDGFWSGWIDQGTLFQSEQQRRHFNQTQQFFYVEFYNITGTIKIAQELF